MNELSCGVTYRGVVGWIAIFVVGVSAVWGETGKPGEGDAATQKGAASQGAAVVVPAEVEKAMGMAEGDERTKAVLGAALEWAKKEPTGALAWAVKLPAALAGKVVIPVAEVNPEASAAWFIEQKKTGYMHPLVYFWAIADPTAAAAWCIKAPKEVRYVAFFSVGDGWVRKDRAAATAWVAKLDAGEDRMAAIHGVALRLGRTDIAVATAWVKELKPEEVKLAAKVIAGDWKLTKLREGGATKAEAVKPWLDQLPLSDSEKQEVLDSPVLDSSGPAKGK